MKILINYSTLKTGGALQVGLSFLEEIKSVFTHHFHVILSNQIREQLFIDGFPNNFHFYNHSVDYGILNIIGYDSFLKSIENEVNPDVVFTLFGPSYWKPRAYHVIGFAKPQYIYKKESPFFNNISNTKKINLWVKERLHLYDFKYFSSEYITESPDVSRKLAQRLKTNRVHTVTNNCSGIYNSKISLGNKISLKKFDGITLLTISANYPHKNLNILPNVISYLRNAYPEFKFRFVLTIEQHELGNLTEEHKKHITFLGKVNVNECPYLYSQSDIMFLPTLLECFSASYPEAMKMEVPIITSDLSFARGICENAAYYVNPLSPQEIGEAILKVSVDKSLQKKLIESGKKQLKKFDTPKERAEKYLKILENAPNHPGP